MKMYVTLNISVLYKYLVDDVHEKGWNIGDHDNTEGVPDQYDGHHDLSAHVDLLVLQLGVHQPGLDHVLSEEVGAGVGEI